jgi:hypothetical protein
MSSSLTDELRELGLLAEEPDPPPTSCEECQASGRSCDFVEELCHCSVLS